MSELTELQTSSASDAVLFELSPLCSVDYSQVQVLHHVAGEGKMTIRQFDSYKDEIANIKERLSEMTNKLKTRRCPD